MSRSLVTLIAFVMCAAPIRAQEEEGVVSYPEYHLSFELPLEEPEVVATKGRYVRGHWTWQLGDADEREDYWLEQTKRIRDGEITEGEASELYWAKFPSVALFFKVMDSANYHFTEPGDVSNTMIDDERKSDKSFQEEEFTLIKGAFGYAPFGAYFEGDTHNKDGEVNGRKLFLCGLLERHGYVLEVRFPKANPSERDLKPFQNFLKREVSYDGPDRDPNWSDEEIVARWERVAPDNLVEEFTEDMKRSGKKKKRVHRTDNYIVLTNSFSGAAFCRNLTENYKTIKKVFPFKDNKGMRLLPVFLFRTQEQYIEFCVKAGDTYSEARASGGHAWKDYYATWYQAPKDPVHIHECTHQLFSNRLHLTGGGSWYQEGVAEYMGSTETERNEVARLVKKGEHTSLSELVKLESLLYSSEENAKGSSGASVHYKQVALLIEFLREGRFGKKHFDTFLSTVGKLPRNHVAKIEAAFQDIYGCSIKELDEQWQLYCKKER